MEKIVEKMTLDEILSLLSGLGHTFDLRKEKGGPEKGGHYLVVFKTPGLLTTGMNCFLFYGADANDHLNVENISLEAYVLIDGLSITPEDINDINKKTIRGRLCLRDHATLGYSLYISFKGGITEKHIVHETETWLRYVQNCRDYVDNIRLGTAEVKSELERIFKSKADEA